MKNAISGLVLMGILGGVATVASAADSACDSQNGVAKANCIQQVNSRWFKEHAQDMAPALAAMMKECDGLYGVAKANCVQQVHSRWNQEHAQNATPARTTTMEACGDLYGVAKTNCLQDVRGRRISATAGATRLAASE
jgi:hypothetical protein